MKRTSITIMTAIAMVILLQSFTMNSSNKENKEVAKTPSKEVGAATLNFENMQTAFKGETTASAK
ncbi:MAG TPA: hypothetical protein VKA38_03800, partial [Draconibacterium sp.]|nr:hypothetical protein [Draconibacterium sp.]